MYHILIVDDEPDILKGISMMMDWELFGRRAAGNRTEL